MKPRDERNCEVEDLHLKKITAVAVLCLIAFGGFLWWRGAQVQESAPERTRTVVDATGRSVVVPTHPQRVALLNASNLDLFCAAGGAALVVGKPTSTALSDSVMRQTATAQEVGVIHSPNLETILALQPDLVVGVNVPFHNALIPMLEKAGIPIVIQPLDTYEQVLNTLRFYGELTGQEQAAADAVKAIEEKSRQAIVRGEGQTRTKSLIVWGASNSFSMATSASFAGDLLQRLGGENIADSTDRTGQAQGFVPLSMEYIAKADPEVIFLITHSMNGAMGDQFAQDPVWKDIRAVKNQRVYLLPSPLFAVNPGTRIGEALEVMADSLYAERER